MPIPRCDMNPITPQARIDHCTRRQSHDSIDDGWIPQVEEQSTSRVNPSGKYKRIISKKVPIELRTGRQSLDPIDDSLTPQNAKKSTKSANSSEMKKRINNQSIRGHCRLLSHK